MKDFLIRFGKIFLILLIIDGAVSVIDDLCALTSGKSFLHSFRITISSLTTLHAILMIVFLTFFSVLPKKVFHPATLLPFIFYAIPAPLILFFNKTIPYKDLQHYTHIDIIHKSWSLGTIYILLGILQTYISYRWFMYFSKKRYFTKDIFDIKSSLIFISINILILFIITPPVFLSNAVLQIRIIGKGFLTADFNQVTSIQKDFIKDNNIVSLIGMVHIGKKDFYNNVIKTFNDENVMILPEGISDKKNLLKIKPTYKKLSNVLALDSQAEEFKIDIKKHKIGLVDIDVSEFSEETIFILNKVLALLNSIGNSNEFLDKYMDFTQYIANNPNSQNTLFTDILTKRNQALIEGINKYIKYNHHIIIPWGAYHLEEIEEYLLKEGYTLNNTINRPVFLFEDLFKKEVKNG